MYDKCCTRIKYLTLMSILRKPETKVGDNYENTGQKSTLRYVQYVVEAVHKYVLLQFLCITLKSCLL